MDQLNDSRESIARDIISQVYEAVGVRPDEVSLKFDSGSIVWTGFVEFLHHVHPYITDMADVGGAIALVQIVASAVNSAVIKWSRMSLRTMANFNPSTQVFFLSRGSQRGRWQPQAIFGAAAVMIGVASLIAAIALLMIAMKR